MVLNFWNDSSITFQGDAASLALDKYTLLHSTSLFVDNMKNDIYISRLLLFTGFYDLFFFAAIVCGIVNRLFCVIFL